jgi:salicylate hydroxylase
VAQADRPILIAGGGIGGLCAAIALSRRDIPVHVLEAAPAFMEIGAGLQIGPNGSRILANWGLGDELRQLGRQPDQLMLKDGPSGRTLAAIPLGETAEARYGAPYLTIARQDLHGALLDAARRMPNITLTSGVRATDWTSPNDGVAVSGSGLSQPVEGRALVAADGVHSALRGKLSPGSRSLPSGKTALRAVATFSRRSQEDNAVCVWMGPNAHLVHYPIGAAGQINIVAVLRDQDVPPDDGAPLDSDQLQTVFGKWSFEAQLLVAGAKSWTRWPLLTMPPVARWSRGAAALLGDAAHPVLPFLASGAVMAIEDAAVIAQELGRSPRDPKTAFLRYEERRRPRLAQLAAAVARTGDIYHMSGPMRQARNLVLGLLPPRMLLARNDWLYGFRP